MTTRRLAAPLLALALAAALAAGDDSKDRRDRAAKDLAIYKKLEKPVPLHFNDAPLGAILEFVTSATRGPADDGIPIRLDPEGIKAPRTTMAMRVSVDTEKGEPLDESLSYLLGKHGLRYRVKDGCLTISETRYTIIDRRKETRALRARLEQPIELRFERAPLEDVLTFIKKASAGRDGKGLPIYVDPVGLLEAETTITTPVSIESKPGEPLKSALERLLKPVGLTYTVKDGLITITARDDVPGAR